jgi:hypothetical protein
LKSNVPQEGKLGGKENRVAPEEVIQTEEKTKDGGCC